MQQTVAMAEIDVRVLGAPGSTNASTPRHSRSPLNVETSDANRQLAHLAHKQSVLSEERQQSTTSRHSRSALDATSDPDNQPWVQNTLRHSKSLLNQTSEPPGHFRHSRSAFSTSSDLDKPPGHCKFR